MDALLFAPWGFQSIYRLGAWFNLAPWDIAKWLPIPLSLATAWGAFLVSETWLPLPAANALTSHANQPRQARGRPTRKVDMETQL